MSFLGLAQAFFTGEICPGSHIFSVWVQFKGQGLDKAVSLLALDLSFKVKIGLGTLFFFFPLVFILSMTLTFEGWAQSHISSLLEGGSFFKVSD